MKLLLDECVPRPFKFSQGTPEHPCMTVPEAGFGGKTNGELLKLVEGEFDVFVTLDKGVEFQQNLAGRKIAILLIRARSNRLNDLLPLVTDCHGAIARIQPGQVVRVGKTE